MSDFLNQFTEKNYENDSDDKELDTNIENSEELEIGSSENSTELVKKKRSGSFEKEVVTINTSYHKERLRRIQTICGTILIVFFVFICIFVFSNFVTVLGFEGEPYSSATAWADKEKMIYDTNYEISTEVDKDVVISQSVEPGSWLFKKNAIVFTVSSGADPKEVVEIPSFKGKSNQDIENFINKNKLDNAKVESEYDDNIPQNNYIYTEFVDEGVNSKNYTRQNKIVFHVSKGKKGSDKKVKMQDFVNKMVDKAQTWAGEKDVLIEQKDVKSDKPLGTVISQSEKKDTLVAPGQTITLEVSKGPGIPTPNFAGLNKTDAQTVATESKVMIAVTEEYNSFVNAGQLISQSIGTGGSFYDEDTITLNYSLGNPFITDYSGQYENEAVNAIVAMNEQGAGLSYNIVYGSGPKGTAKGYVYKCRPYGSYVNVGSKITIYVQK